MSLEEKLAAIREGAKARVPEEKRAVMGQATKDLRETGILDGVIGVGDTLPPFALASARGGEVTSGELLGAQRLPWQLVTLLQCRAVRSAGKYRYLPVLRRISGHDHAAVAGIQHHDDRTPRSGLRPAIGPWEFLCQVPGAGIHAGRRSARGLPEPRHRPAEAQRRGELDPTHAGAVSSSMARGSSVPSTSIRITPAGRNRRPPSTP
jgi:hypothetical protein